MKMTNILAVGLILILGAVLGPPTSASANTSACWGEDSRTDISCTKITERLLLRLGGDTEATVRRLMAAPGRITDEGLHYTSNYDHGQSGGTGDVNVEFENGRAASVFATVDNPNGAPLTYIWSAYEVALLGQEIDRSTLNYRRQPLCSDLSGKPESCAGASEVDQLTQMQMEGNIPKSQVLMMLNAVCASSSDNGNCPMLRDLLQ